MATTTSEPNHVLATREHQRRAAVRALDDPATLARAARIVREALARKRLTLADIAPDHDGGASHE